MTAKKLKDGDKMINAETKLFVLIGHNINHSKSPVIHNKFFELTKINAVYVCLDIKSENLKKVIDGIKILGIKAGNITMPFKESIMPFLDSIDVNAKKMGAVNTFVNQNGKLKGFNTDGTGFVNALKEKTKIKGKKILIIGCGGAGKAIAFTLKKEKPALIILADKNQNKAEKLSLKIKNSKAIPIKQIGKELNDADILINASSVGFNEYKSPVKEEFLHKKLTE